MPATVARLKRRSEFLRVAGSGNKCAMPGLVVQMCRRPADPSDVGPIRYGLTASKRVGNAVERNRARRRLRSLAEQVLPEHAEVGCDYVLIGRTATLRRPYTALVDDLTKAVARLSRPRTDRTTGRLSDPRNGSQRDRRRGRRAKHSAAPEVKP